MKVTVFTTMPPGVYSGGRYLSLILAHAMARAGAEVAYVTNNAPLFERDFAPYAAIAPVRSIVTANFALPADLASDWVVVIPTGGFNNRFYNAAIDHARAQGARLALISFETPNWYAALSPFPRSPMPTESWRQVVEGGGLVVAIAAEGVDPARAYFGEGSERAPRRFGFWHPAINDLAAAAAMGRAGEVPRRSITMFVRTEDPHKGADTLLRLDPALFEGHVLSLVFGRGVDTGFVAALRRHFAPARDFAIEVLAQISDEEKFALLARSRVLLFPSWFEGYGYPPVEAAWMGVPTVAWDLPLLREVAGDAVMAVPPGDVAAFGAALRQTLATRPAGPAVRAMMRVQTDTLTAGQAMLGLLAEAAAQVPPAAPPAPALPVAGGGGGLDARAGQFLSHQAKGVALYEAAASLREGRVSFAARIEGMRKDDQLYADLPGGSMPLMLADTGGAEAARRIAGEGQLDRWPGGAQRLAMRLTLRRADQSRLALGAVELAPDWAALMAPSAEGGTRRAGDHVVLADPAQIAGRPRLAALLAEVCGTLRRAGGRVSLVMPRRPAPPGGDLVPDLLPAFDSVTATGSGRMRRILAETAEAGGIIAATRARLAPAGLDAAAGLVLDPGGGPGDEIVLFLPDGLSRGATGRAEVAPDARLWGRRGRQAALAPVVVLVPGRPLAGDLDAGLRRPLKRLEQALPGLRVVTPQALVAAPLPPLAGVTARLEPLDPVALAALLAEGGARVAGLAAAAGAADGMAGGDPCPAARAAAALIAAYRLPLVTAAEGDDAATLAALMAHLAEPAGGAVAALLGAAAAPAAAPALPGDGLPPLPPPPAPAPRPAPPVLAAGDVLSLGTTLGEEAPALATGWADRTLLGARIAQDRGVLCFRLAAPAAACPRLEVMLHLSPAADPGLSVKVMLNGHLLGTLARLPAGASVHVLTVREEAWARGTEQRGADQVLALHLQRGEGANAASKITLVALSPGGAAAPPLRPPAPPAGGSGAAARMAPLYAAPIEAGGGLLRCRLAKGAAAGFVQLAAGWSVPEAEFTWSVGPLAVLSFQPPLTAAVPVLLRLRGNTLAAPAAEGQRAGQRLILRDGARVLARAWLDGAATSTVALALPAGMALERLFLDLPDAISPAAVGAGADQRSLGLALGEAEARLLPRRLDAAALTATAAAQIRAAAPGVLRLVGAGPVPQDLQLGLAGGILLVSPLPRAGGGWEASLPITAETLAAGRADLLCLAPGAVLPPGPMTVESWAEASAEAGGLAVSLAALPDAGPAGRLAGPLPAPLPLPAVFDLGQDSADPGLLGPGWSHPEPAGVWSGADLATLVLPAPAPAAILGIEATALVMGPVARQRVVLAAAGRALATVVYGTNVTQRVAVVLPPAAAPWAALHLALPDALVPAEAGLLPDTRRIALRLQRLEIAALPPALADTLAETPPDAPPEPAILRQAALAGGGRAILVAGPGPGLPFGLAPASMAEVAVIAHALPGPGGGWQACLVLGPGDVTADGQVTLALYDSAAEAEEGTPSEVLFLPLPAADDPAGGAA